jgi:hypothetical protein
MITSIFIVLRGNVNPVFPSLPMHTLLTSKFPGTFSWKQKISLSSNFPCMLDEGNLEDKSVPHYLSLESCTLSKIIGTTMDSIWRHRPVHIRTITLPVFIPQSWTFQLWDKIRFMRMRKKNEKEWKAFIPQSQDNQTAFKTDQHTTRDTSVTARWS